MTVGDRLSNGSYGEENDRAFHGFGNDLVRWLIKVIYGFAFDDVMTGYRGFTRAFVKTMPVTSAGFQIETEISIWAVDRRWRVADVPIAYRDRPEGSTRSCRPSATAPRCSWPSRACSRTTARWRSSGGWRCCSRCSAWRRACPWSGSSSRRAGGQAPPAVLAVALVMCGALSLTAGLILDTVAKSSRRAWELEVYKVAGRSLASPSRTPGV